MSVLAGRRLGSILVDAQVLSEPALADALERQRASGERLGAVLVGMGVLDEQAIVAALGIQLDLPVVGLRHRVPDDDAVALLPEDLARALPAAPVRRTPDGLEVAVSDRLDPPARERLEAHVGGRVVLRLAAASDVHEMIDRSYAAVAPVRHTPGAPPRRPGHAASDT